MFVKCTHYLLSKCIGSVSEDVGFARLSRAKDESQFFIHTEIKLRFGKFNVPVRASVCKRAVSRYQRRCFACKQGCFLHSSKNSKVVLDSFLVLSVYSVLLFISFLVRVHCLIFSNTNSLAVILLVHFIRRLRLGASIFKKIHLTGISQCEI